MVLDTKKQQDDLLRVLVDYEPKQSNYQMMLAKGQMISELVQTVQKAQVLDIGQTQQNNNENEKSIKKKGKKNLDY